MTNTPDTLPTWHAGELFIQQQLGVAQRMEEIGRRAVRDFMPEQHRDFYAQLPFIVAGSVDADGNAWATALQGRPGFMSSPAPDRLVIAARPDPADPAAAGMTDGAALGLLGIELHTRRRNRMNGVLTDTSTALQVAVQQSFGNCPRYIQRRDYRFARDPALPAASQAEELPALDRAARRLIAGADTFFVASYADRETQRQVDVSHRGGEPGFVQVSEDGTLTVPDFSGNRFFSTLGNLLLNQQAGLLFIDFDSGDVLQMTGHARVMLDSPDLAAFKDAERLWTFQPRRVLRRPGALALRWHTSASTSATGDVTLF